MKIRSARRPRLPWELAILPDRRWSGKLKVLGESAHPDEPHFVVAFDAEDLRADPQERYVYDHNVLSNAQLLHWTGVDVAAGLHKSDSGEKSDG